VLFCLRVIAARDGASPAVQRERPGVILHAANLHHFAPISR
jgi:hypothetical protein